MIKKRLDIGIENDSIALLMEFDDFGQSTVAVTSWTEAEGRVVEQPFDTMSDADVYFVSFGG